MAEKKPTFDVWIIETNTVYRQVPYAVVTDWAEQGRLLEDDRIRVSGATQWLPIGEVAAFAPFLPKAGAHRAEDQAEALEQVQTELRWKTRHSDEDDDVDMIPLIDVSLVLLIFFMMTATVVAISDVATPEAQHVELINPDMYWISVIPGRTGDDNRPRYTYAVGKGEGSQAEGRFKNDLGPANVIKKLEELLKDAKQPVNVRVRGEHRIPCEVVTKDLRAELSRLKAAGKVDKFFIEVSEKKP